MYFHHSAHIRISFSAYLQYKNIFHFSKLDVLICRFFKQLVFSKKEAQNDIIHFRTQNSLIYKFHTILMQIATFIGIKLQFDKVKQFFKKG